jgi:TonB family protein
MIYMKSVTRLIALTIAVQVLPVAGFCADKKSPKPLNTAEISKRAAAATVVINCLGEGNAKSGDVSGFLVSQNGEIVTSLRSIAPCRQLAVRIPNGDLYDAVSVVGMDLRRDLVVIRVKAASLPVLPLGDSNEIEVGQTLYSPGPPNGAQITLQTGLISAIRQMDGYKLVQMSSPIDPRWAGGPVLDDQGRVVAIAAKPVAGAENQGFALPVNYAKGYLDSAEEMPFSGLASAVKSSAVIASDTAKAPVLVNTPSLAPGVGGLGSGGGIGSGPARPMSVGPGITPPKIISKREPAYSEQARKAKLEGSVLLSLVIDENGKPIDIKVVRSLGMGLDEKAIEAVKQWRFEPGKKDGKPVSIASQIQITFHLL